MRIVNNKLKVAVLAGGIGEERDVSIQSGNCVAEALQKTGLNVITSDIRPDNMEILEDHSIDVFFIALHGKFGEDGQLQQILEARSLIYTGSGPTASRLAFDKMASKKIFAEAGVDTPPAIQLNPDTDTQQLEKQLQQFADPVRSPHQRGTRAEGGYTSNGADKYVIKPLRQGSSVGVSIVTEPRKAINAAKKCQSEFGDCMIEKFIPGRMITVGILCSQPLPIIEVRTQTSFYDYYAKYIDEQTEYLLDTISDTAMTEKIKAAALDCFNALGCRHFGRVDFILGEDKKTYALEVNTIPGMTAHSLLPKAAAKTGLSMSNLCLKIVEAAYPSLVTRHP